MTGYSKNDRIPASRRFTVETAAPTVDGLCGPFLAALGALLAYIAVYLRKITKLGDGFDQAWGLSGSGSSGTS